MYFGHYQKGKYSAHLIAVPGLFTVEAAKYIIETDAMERAPCHLFSPSLRLALFQTLVVHNEIQRERKGFFITCSGMQNKSALAIVQIKTWHQMS